MLNEKEKKNLFDDLLSFLPVPFFITDSEGFISQTNREGEKILNLKGYEIVDRNISEFIKEEENVLSRDIRAKEATLKAENEEVPILLFSESFTGEKELVFISCIDLRESKKIKRDMQEKVDELERFTRLATGRELRMVELKRERDLLMTEKEKLQKKLDSLN